MKKRKKKERKKERKKKKEKKKGRKEEGESKAEKEEKKELSEQSLAMYIPALAGVNGFISRVCCRAARVVLGICSCNSIDITKQVSKHGA